MFHGPKGSSPVPCSVPRATCRAVPRKKGRYFFEVELHFGVESPQVGLLASHFELAPRTADPHGEQLGFFGAKIQGEMDVKWI